jgi:hypothetical protein
MEFWQIFWAVFLFGSLGLFGVLALVVSVGGLSDIMSLFRKIGGESTGDGTDARE